MVIKEIDRQGYKENRYLNGNLFVTTKKRRNIETKVYKELTRYESRNCFDSNRTMLELIVTKQDFWDRVRNVLEIEDSQPNDDKILFESTNRILLPKEEGNLLIFYQDVSAEREPDCNLLKLEPNTNRNIEGEDASSNNSKDVIGSTHPHRRLEAHILSMEHEPSLLADFPGTSSECKPNSGHLKSQFNIAKDK
ncbi:hypothetical protein QYM36_008867, partial [Artemia franciscana]